MFYVLYEFYRGTYILGSLPHEKALPRKPVEKCVTYLRSRLKKAISSDDVFRLIPMPN